MASHPFDSSLRGGDVDGLDHRSVPLAVGEGHRYISAGRDQVEHRFGFGYFGRDVFRNRTHW